MAAHLGLGLKPIPVRSPPESTSLQKQFVSTQANLFLRGRLSRDRVQMGLRLEQQEPAWHGKPFSERTNRMSSWLLT